jgi:hypothetical protein
MTAKSESDVDAVLMSQTDTVLSEQEDSRIDLLDWVHGVVPSMMHSVRTLPNCWMVLYKQHSFAMSQTAIHPASPPSAANSSRPLVTTCG